MLSVDGTKVEDTQAFMVAGVRPYSISISPKGDIAVLTNQGGGQGDTDIISVIDLKKSPPRIVESHSVGQIPEGTAFSHDGSHVAVTIQKARLSRNPINGKRTSAEDYDFYSSLFWAGTRTRYYLLPLRAAYFFPLRISIHG